MRYNLGKRRGGNVPSATASKETHETIRATVEQLVEKALKRQASDIHIEPHGKVVTVRFRVDGWLQEASKLPARRFREFAKYVKKLGGLDEKVKTTPQHGSAEFDSSMGRANLDISTMPTMDGEKIVIHLSLELREPATLESLGYWGDTLRTVEYAIAEPHGLVLVASPDKTAVSMSLLGVVHLLNNPALDIATLEDSLSQRVHGVSQTKVRPEHGSFKDYLQAALKQDPNVIMLSRFQDSATVDLGLQTALSGHLLLGGLHVGSAAAAVSHILHLHNEPFLVAASLKAVMAQRFVRRLCDKCRETYQPDQAEQKAIKQLLRSCNVKSMKSLHELERSAALVGLGGTGGKTQPGTMLSSTEHRIVHLWRANPEGCQHCHFTGYTGRLGVCEAIAADDSLRQLIAKNPSTSQIRDAALKNGMLPMQLDAFIKALRGLTSISEILSLSIHN
jgi:type II secretory ATPase GspE/PulE/Tfp pilus assembly ATPase PilB-like protein